MTQHSIEELRRQYEEARSRADAAGKKARAAREALDEATIDAKKAELAGKGITIGETIVNVYRARGGAFVGQYGVLDVGIDRCFSDRPAVLTFSKLERDGAVGKSRIYLGGGLYVEAAKDQPQ